MFAPFFLVLGAGAMAPTLSDATLFFSYDYYLNAAGNFSDLTLSSSCRAPTMSWC
jgi:hypothetical protein